MTKRYSFLGPVVAFAALAAMTVTASAASYLASSGLVPHRAFYSMHLLEPAKHGTSSTSITGVDGVMTMSIEQTCDGWIFTQDMSAVFDLADGPTVRQTAAFTSWEATDGSSYQFASKVDTAGSVTKLGGTASMNEKGGEAQYTKPEEATVTLPAGVLFPVSHTAWLIDQARAGKNQVSRIVFTGSENLKPELVNAFIAGRNDAASTPKGVTVLDNKLTRTDGWLMTLAFYDAENKSGLPTLEMRALQLDNGVSPWIVMDYGDFATLMTAEKIEPLPRPDCS